LVFRVFYEVKSLKIKKAISLCFTLYLGFAFTNLNTFFIYLESQKINYVIAGRMHLGMQATTKQIKSLTALGFGIWINEID